MKPCPDDTSAEPTKVMFDGACPLCRREIALYQDLKAKSAMQWVDISTCEFEPPIGMSKAQLMQRFHIVTPEGLLLSGAVAFVFVWDRMPGWHWLARLSRLPGMLALMELSYRGFLIIRPALQKLARLGERHY